MRTQLIITSILIGFSCTAQLKQISSNNDAQWEKNEIELVSAKKVEADIVINPKESLQTIEGWGGCFNEKGWKAMQYLTAKEQKEIMTALFAEDQCDFGYCRMPIGASDYALNYYSLNDVEGDYAMKNFSIDRDRKYMLPYIKAAMAIEPELQVWGSPWTPPAWMKDNKDYCRGTINMDKKNLDAYALYFQKYVEAYRNEGVNIVAIHPQNEPLHLPAFPSCGWNGQQLKTFIQDHLGPRFVENKLDCEIWLGTINGDDTDEYKEYIAPILGDEASAKYVTGAGFQWYGDAAVEPMIKNFPDKKMMQTETKCGDGANDWNYAFQTYNQMVWYLERNSNYYLQWNMILDETGMSAWGWKQCAMVTVDTYNKSYKLNPQYWLVRHFTQYVKPEAKRIVCESKEDIQALAFQNTDGSIVLVASNQSAEAKEWTVKNGKKAFTLKMKPNSVSTVCLD